MLLCSDSSSEDDSGLNFSGLDRHREALATGLPEWDDSQSHSSSNSSINQSDLFNKFGSQSFRRGRCGSPHPKQMYSTRKSYNATSLLALKNLPSPPQPTSPTAGDGPLSITQSKGLKMANTNNSNSHGAKIDKSSRIKMGIGKQSHQNGHAECAGSIPNPRFVPKPSVQMNQRQGQQQVIRVQVHQAAVTKLERTKPLPGNCTFWITDVLFINVCTVPTYEVISSVQ